MHSNSRMWTLDCEDYVKNFKNDNSLFEQKRIKKNTRKRRRIIRHFRHLLPIIPSSSSMAVPLPLPPLPPPAISEQFSWKDHLIMSKVEKMKKKKKKNISSLSSSEEDATAGLVVSSRWNPTPEQLKALQEMYQRGVRTPSAEEIQLIAAKLRHFGRIEGKNVFYWFQNHKARERQKWRRQPPPPDDIGTRHDNSKHSSDFCPSLIWKEMDADQSKKIVTNTSNSILAPKGCGSTAVTESRSNGWTHLDEKQQRQQQSFHRRTAAPLKEDKMILWADQEKIDDEEDDSNSRVLHLFPVIVDGDRIPFGATKNSKERNEEEMSSSQSTLCAKITPNQFYEFL